MKTIILAGGHGTRLWPMSTSLRPKQFQKLLSDDTMLKSTIKRLSFQKPEDIFVATIADFVPLVKEEIKNLIPEENIIIEPALRDTAPCIGYIASIMAKKDPEAVMAIIYADHLIQDTDELKTKLQIAEQIAKKKGTINIIEVKAVYPNTNLGYVQIGEKVEKINEVNIHSFVKFIEKPDKATAEKLLEQKNCLWNTGLYVCKAKTMLEKFKAHQTKTYELLIEIQKDLFTEKQTNTTKNLYPQTEKISIDYAIMEKLKPEEMLIIPASLGWNDIGTWQSIWEELNKNNKNNNVIRGDIFTEDTENCLIYGPKNKPIAVIGVKDLVIVDTGDGLLIADRLRSGEIKKMTSEIKMKHPDKI